MRTLLAALLVPNIFASVYGSQVQIRNEEPSIGIDAVIESAEDAIRYVSFYVGSPNRDYSAPKRMSADEFWRSKELGHYITSEGASQALGNFVLERTRKQMHAVLLDAVHLSRGFLHTIPKASSTRQDFTRSMEARYFVLKLLLETIPVSDLQASLNTAPFTSPRVTDMAFELLPMVQSVISEYTEWIKSVGVENTDRINILRNELTELGYARGNSREETLENSWKVWFMHSVRIASVRAIIYLLESGHMVFVVPQPVDKGRSLYNCLGSVLSGTTGKDFWTWKRKEFILSVFSELMNQLETDKGSDIFDILTIASKYYQTKPMITSDGDLRDWTCKEILENTKANLTRFKPEFNPRDEIRRLFNYSPLGKESLIFRFIEMLYRTLEIIKEKFPGMNEATLTNLKQTKECQNNNDLGSLFLPGILDALIRMKIVENEMMTKNRASSYYGERFYQ